MSQQPPDSGAPDSTPSGPPPGPAPYNPYAQPPGPLPSQPVWQGHQAPQQVVPGTPGDATASTGRRRAWLIAIAVVVLVALAGGAITAVVLTADEDAGSAVSVADIETGDCLVSDELADESASVSSIERVDCADEHDAEVFATLELGAGDDITDAGANCVTALADTEQSWAALDGAGLEVRPLVAGEEEGDEVVCFIRHRDGQPLTGSEFE